jgi:hypothetical protein
MRRDGSATYRSRVMDKSVSPKCINLHVNQRNLHLRPHPRRRPHDWDTFLHPTYLNLHVSLEFGQSIPWSGAFSKVCLALPRSFLRLLLHSLYRTGSEPASIMGHHRHSPLSRSYENGYIESPLKSVHCRVRVIPCYPF